MCLKNSSGIIMVVLEEHLVHFFILLLTLRFSLTFKQMSLIYLDTRSSHNFCQITVLCPSCCQNSEICLQVNQYHLVFFQSWLLPSVACKSAQSDTICRATCQAFWLPMGACSDVCILSKRHESWAIETLVFH